jgi:transcriptional regulator of nitric oxide reductase
VGYVFESSDLAPIPGFAGVPLNLLVAMDAKGTFTDVEVLSHHEPVFLEGLGEGPLRQFVQQYRGLSLKQGVSIGGAGHGHIDGVAKATASVRIINQSVLAAALKVARGRLGFGAVRDPDQTGTACAGAQSRRRAAIPGQRWRRSRCGGAHMAGRYLH